MNQSVHQFDSMSVCRITSRAGLSLILVVCVADYIRPCTSASFQIRKQTTSSICLKAPWTKGQRWKPSTYTYVQDGQPGTKEHPPGKELAIDFNRSDGDDTNQPILAAHSGTLTKMPCSEVSPGVCSGLSYGNLAKVTADDGSFTTWYAHLSSFTTRTDSHVNAGDIVGYAGKTGNASGVHLHFELRFGNTPQVIVRNLSLDDQPISIDFDHSTTQRDETNKRTYSIFYGNDIVSANDGSGCGSDDAQFAGQSNYPTVAVNSAFQISFSLNNTGTNTWKGSGGYALKSLGDATFGANDTIPVATDVPSRESFTFTINMRAPNSTGTLRTSWQLDHNGTRFGPQMFIDVSVIRPNQPWAAELVSQFASDHMPLSGSAQFIARFRNTGTTTWQRDGLSQNPVNLGTAQPHDRVPSFLREDQINHSPSGWISPNRVRMQEDSVSPGGIGTFVFWMSPLPGRQPELVREYFQLVADNPGGTWFDGTEISWEIRITPTRVFDAQLFSQSASPVTPAGGSCRFEVSFRNTGTSGWNNSGATPVNLGTADPRDRTPDFVREDLLGHSPSGWISPNRVSMQQGSVPPGGIGTFVFWMSPASNHATGTFPQRFQLVADNTPSGWLDGTEVSWDVTVTPPRPWAAQLASQSPSPSMPLGGAVRLSASFRNVGTSTWYRDGLSPTPLNLGTARDRDRTPGFLREDQVNHSPSGWISPNRVRLQEDSVPPGGTGTFTFWMSALTNHPTGTFPEYFQLVVDNAGGGWMEGTEVHWDINVVVSTGGGGVGGGPTFQTQVRQGLSALGLGASGVFTREDLNLLNERIAAWDSETQQYVYDGQVAQISAGKGYWIKTASARTLDYSGDAINGPLLIPLSGWGWNLVSSPFSRRLVWDAQAIKVRRGIDEKTLADAKQSGWIEDCGWIWQQDTIDGRTGHYVLVCDASHATGVAEQIVNELPAMTAFWINASINCDLVLPASISTTNAARNLRKAIANDWLVPITATVNGATDTVTIGAASRSFKAAKPPSASIGGAIDLSILPLQGNAPLGTDVRRELTTNNTWEIMVRAREANAEVSLIWSQLARAPRNLRYYLVDQSTGIRRYMRTTTAYTFRTSGPGEQRKLRIEIEPAPNDIRLVSQLSVLTSSVLGGARFSLVLSNPATVNARIITASGKVVAVVTPSIRARQGLNTFNWNGKSASGLVLARGIYLIETTATTDDGQEVKAVKSLTLK